MEKMQDGENGMSMPVVQSSEVSSLVATAYEKNSIILSDKTV